MRLSGIGDVVGAFGQGTKLAKVAKVVGTTIRAAQKMYVTTASASKALDMAGDAKIEYAVNGGEMTSSVRRKILGSAAMAGVSILLGKSLMKDARSFAKTAEIRFNTTSKETVDVISGKNYQYEGVAGCFIAGTTVKTADGEKNIEDVECGDYVLAENPETGEQEYKKVVRTFIHEKYLLVHVYAEDEEIITTEEHPFYVGGIGFVSAGELQCGDILRLADGRKIPVKQKGFEYLEEPVLVYNFEVEDFHTYYVSELGVLVHNMCEVSQNTKGGTNSRYLKEGYTSGRRSSNLFGRDRSTRKTSMFTEWRRSIRKSDLANERRLFLGEDYVKVDKGKWRSLDGTRQFRLKPDDYIGAHPIGMPSVNNVPHVHFEFLTPRSNGNGFDVVKNIHVPLIDD